MSRAFSAVGSKLPKGWGDFGRQIMILVLVDLAYTFVRGIVDSEKALAMTHGQQIIDFEKSIGLFFEPSWQTFFLPAQWVIDFANQIYLNAQFSIAIGFLLWLYLFRNESYYFVRNMFVVAMGIALVGYTLYPTAPPRMYPQYGFIDTLNAYSDVGHDSSLAKIFINPYAAVPSMHCAFSMMIGGTGFLVCRHWLSRGLWVCWPLLVSWVTIVTANHYWVDAVLGWMVALAAALAAARLARVRPEAWAFRARAPREVEA
ncbi:MAG TPA: phosphatase PAP2 family protein [Solirubrobacterales bacterium]|nr:phosphatase PAP2 family protein [Solirubrobacterales bacterium]